MADHLQKRLGPAWFVGDNHDIAQIETTEPKFDEALDSIVYANLDQLRVIRPHDANSAAQVLLLTRRSQCLAYQKPDTAVLASFLKAFTVGLCVDASSAITMIRCES
jgi:hypothetical protein